MSKKESIPTQKVIITNVSYSHYWYRDLVGQEVILTQEEDGEWVVKRPEIKRLLGIETKVIAATIDNRDYKLIK